MSKGQNKSKTLRLILGDQLNEKHSWFSSVDPDVTYLMMETRSETDYATHHIQKVVVFFASMRDFAAQLSSRGHRLIYLKINDPQNLQRLDKNCEALISENSFIHFEYQLPDEYRVDQVLSRMCDALSVSSKAYDTEHFYTDRKELASLFKGKKAYLMETFYRHMRKKHNVLMEKGEPLNGQWNFDEENRKKLPKNIKSPRELTFNNDVSEVYKEVVAAGVKTMGTIDATTFVWPVNRGQSLKLLDFFVKECLVLFGTYQDAMSPNEWSLFHSRLSFSMNTKMISPKEVVDRAIAEYQKRTKEIAYHQLEGFVRQIIGWREYMRGIYWMKMPEYSSLNFFNHQRKLPSWYWTGETKMNCLRDCISQSLKYAYAHHIQRLMITGNFALLIGADPDEVDQWYLGIYIDALDWVEITNTRGMSQYADGGVVATKPYISSASYVDKMSHYCTNCYYDKTQRTGEKACPFNSLYWHFLARNEDRLKKNLRMGMMYRVWNKFNKEQQYQIVEQAEKYLNNLDHL